MTKAPEASRTASRDKSPGVALAQAAIHCIQNYWKPAVPDRDTAPSTADSKPIKVLIADDHSLVRNGLAQLINHSEDCSVCCEAANGEETLIALAEKSCELLLLDLSMPPPNGQTLIKLVRESHPTLPILVVTMHESVAIVSAVLQAGANGYISKTCEPSELIEGIREVARGGTYLPAGMIQSLLDAQRKAQPELSRREKEVLTHIAAGLSNTQIARKLHISEKTVSTHKVNLMEKLAITNASDLIRFADNYLLLLDQ